MSNYSINRENAHIQTMIGKRIDHQKEISYRYSMALADVQKEIDAFYGKYASQEKITIAEAKKRVAKMDIDSFANKAKQLVKNKDFSPEANSQLRLYNLTMKINRLEMLKANIGIDLTLVSDDMARYMLSIFKSEALAELIRQAGILGESVWNSSKLIDEIIHASFHNATFSDNIWVYQDKLKAELDRILSKGMAQGKHPRALAREIREALDVTVKEAQRLMITESARIQTGVRKRHLRNTILTNTTS